MPAIRSGRRPPVLVPGSGLALAMAVVLLAAAAGESQAAGEAVAAPGPTTVHVSPSGSDSAAGTAGAPLRTVRAALGKLGSAGGTVQLAGGTYRKERVVLENRQHITLQAASGAKPVLDGSGLSPADDRTGMIEIRNSSDIAVRGLTITGYRTKSGSAVPVGILVEGSGDTITLEKNHVHTMGNDNTKSGSGSDEGAANAHGIAVYGTNASTSITDLTVVGNELDHLVLGQSETLVLNGNVDGWSITDNVIHDNNNIGIDIIGYEDTLSDQFSEKNRARNGVVSRNKVSGITSEGNPGYPAGCNCADGIYVDGGTGVVISDNQVDDSDIGIEVASEWKKGRTNDITVTGNTVTNSRYAGLAIGGYDADRGEAYGVRVTGNTLRNNTRAEVANSGEILLQYYVHDSSITGNTVVAGTAGGKVLVSRVAPSGSSAKNARVVLDRNTYSGPMAPGRDVYRWNGVERKGLPAYRRASGQEKNSTYTRS